MQTNSAYKYKSDELDAEYLGTFESMDGRFNWRLFKTQDGLGQDYLCFLYREGKQVARFKRANMAGVEHSLGQFIDGEDER